MKNRAISTMLIICLVVTMLMPMGIKPQEVSAAESFTIRTSMPKLNDKNAKYYYSDINRFWKAGRLAPDFNYYEKIMDDGKTGGYIWGNCTWWTYSRASEVKGEMLNPDLRGNAGSWWECNKKGNFYPYGQTPKVGSIVVYKSHVAFVEKIVGDQIYVSESGWQTKTYGPSSTDDFYFHYGIPWRNKETPKGYIYVTEKISVEDIETIPADYSVKVSYDNLRMRNGPGTGFDNMGYASKGIHKLKATTADGTWGQLESNGYWISLEFTESAEKSSNNNLKSLSVDKYAVTPEFDADTTEYAVTVPNEDNSVVISAKKTDTKAAVTGTGTKTLAVGLNTYIIKVTAENGDVKEYTVNITREPVKKVRVKVEDLNMRTGPGSSYKSKGKIKPGIYSIINVKNGWGKVKSNGYWISLKYTEEYVEKSGNNNLESIIVGKNRKLTPEFDSEKLSYTVTIPNNIIAISIKAVKAHEKAKVTGTGKKKPKVGTNTYKIKVTAENGKVKTYTVKIVRKAYRVKVTEKNLNMRTGPGTSYNVKGKIKPGTYTIVQKKNGWGKLKTNGYWIKLSYTKKVN